MSGVWISGCVVWGLGFGFWGSGFWVRSLSCRVWVLMQELVINRDAVLGGLKHTLLLSLALLLCLPADMGTFQGAQRCFNSFGCYEAFFSLSVHGTPTAIAATPA